MRIEKQKNNAKLTPFEACSACSKVADNSLESAISMLGNLMNFMDPPNHQYKGNEFDSNRDLLYLSINKINEYVQWFDLSFTSLHDLTTLSAAEIASVALDAQNLSSLAYRYALLNLTPFAVVGNNILFDAHNDANQLDLYQPQPVYSTVPATGSLSHEWITDRANMLAWKLKLNGADAQSPEYNYGTPTYLGLTTAPSQYFWDITSGEKIYLGGMDRSQIIFGSVNADPIDGGVYNDHLYGGAGNDDLFLSDMYAA